MSGIDEERKSGERDNAIMTAIGIATATVIVIETTVAQPIAADTSMRSGIQMRLHPN
jgi:uncharacterized ion transporter superfamily protein YfcC